MKLVPPCLRFSKIMLLREKLLFIFSQEQTVAVRHALLGAVHMPINVKHLFAVLTVFVSLSVNACATDGQPLAADQKEVRIQNLIEKKDFVGIFKHSRFVGIINDEMGIDVSDIVEEYFRKNGDSREFVVETLKRGGFEVPSGSTHTKSELRRGISYDEKVVGSKIGTPLHLYRFTRYKAYIFLKDGRVNRVVAHTFSDGL